MVCAAVIRTGILTNTNLNSLWVTTTSNRQLSAGRKTDILQGTVRLKNPTLGVYEYQHRTVLTAKPCCRLLYPLCCHLSHSPLGGSTHTSMVLGHAVVFYISCHLSHSHLVGSPHTSMALGHDVVFYISRYISHSPIVNLRITAWY